MLRHAKVVPAVGRLEDVPGHGLSEPGLVLLGRGDCRPVATAASEPAVLDPGLEALVPCIGADAVDDSDDELFAGLVNGDHERVVHHVLSCEEECVVPDL